MDYRWNLFDVDSARLAGAEILNLAPDVVLCGGTPITLAMQQATRTVPIVFAFVTDPVGQGIVSNLARPGGNLTGFSYFEPAVAAKWLELLKEIAPTVTRVSFMFNPVWNSLFAVVLPVDHDRCPKVCGGAINCGDPRDGGCRANDDHAWT